MEHAVWSPFFKNHFEHLHARHRTFAYTTTTSHHRFQVQIREVQSSVEEEQRARDEAREMFNQAERRANSLSAEIEELRTQLEAAERARKTAEGECYEAAERVSELSQINSSLNSVKRKLETDIQAMQVGAGRRKDVFLIRSRR